MRIAIVTPHYYPAVRGSAVTVRRIEKQINKRGHECRVFSLDRLSAEEILLSIKGFAPQLMHAFHGYLGGRIARLTALETGIPYIISLVESDIYEVLEECGRREQLRAALRDAVALVTAHRFIKTRLAERCPGMAGKTAIIPQGVELPGEDCQGGKKFPFSEEKFVFFLPAGLRPVKNVTFPLAPLVKLHAANPSLGLLLAGPILDSRYAAEVMDRLKEISFAYYCGEVSHETIGCLFKKADVVLNTSLFEGGIADTLLEAMVFCKPILASSVEGNCALIRDGFNGFLYRSEEDFTEKAGRLIKDAVLRRRFGELGKQCVLADFSAEKEAEGYLEIYRSICKAGD